MEVEKIREEKIEYIIQSDTRKISEDFEHVYKIEKKDSNKSLYFMNNSNNNFENEIKEKNFANYNEFSITDENDELAKLSLNTRSEKHSIINFVFEAPEENKVEKFSIHKNEIVDNFNNYKNPFGKKCNNINYYLKYFSVEI